MIRYMFYLLFALLSFQVPAANAASATQPLPVRSLPDFTISRGQVLYQRYCLFCHGKTGAGDGQNAYSLPRPPADLGKILLERTPEQLIAVVRGDKSTDPSRRTMPSFAATLSNLQINELLEYIQNFPETKEAGTEDRHL